MKCVAKIASLVSEDKFKEFSDIIASEGISTIDLETAGAGEVYRLLKKVYEKFALTYNPVVSTYIVGNETLTGNEFLWSPLFSSLMLEEFGYIVDSCEELTNYKKEELSEKILKSSLGSELFYYIYQVFNSEISLEEFRNNAIPRLGEVFSFIDEYEDEELRSSIYLIASALFSSPLFYGGYPYGGEVSAVEITVGDIAKKYGMGKSLPFLVIDNSDDDLGGAEYYAYLYELFFDYVKLLFASTKLDTDNIDVGKYSINSVLSEKHLEASSQEVSCVEDSEAVLKNFAVERMLAKAVRGV